MNVSRGKVATHALQLMLEEHKPVKNQKGETVDFISSFNDKKWINLQQQSHWLQAMDVLKKYQTVHFPQYAFPERSSEVLKLVIRPITKALLTAKKKSSEKASSMSGALAQGNSKRPKHVECLDEEAEDEQSVEGEGSGAESEVIVRAIVINNVMMRYLLVM